MRISMKPPPPMLPGRGMHDRERKSRGDRGVDRVAAGLQHLYAGLRCELVDAHHHAVLGALRPHAAAGQTN